MQALNADIAGNRNLAHKAHWEHKTDRKIQDGIVKGRVAEMRAQYAANLEQRRAKLAALLAHEDKQYEAEFNAKQETPEQVRQAMAERLNTLKASREAERQAEVQRRLDQKFKMESDALRQEDSRFYTVGTQIEREKQLIDKRRQIEQRMAEEQVYAQLYALDAQKKLEREQLEAQEKLKLAQDTKSVLDWQKTTREAVREQDKSLIQQERGMLKEQWAAEQAREKRQEHERYILNLERNKALIAHNEQEKMLREQAELAEKQRDLLLLNA